MKKIELRRLSLSSETGLFNIYAHKREGNEIDHYFVSVIQSALNKIKGISDLELIKDYIEKRDGEPVEVVLLPVSRPLGLDSFQDISDLLLRDDQDIKKSLLKTKVDTVLMQKYVPILTRSKIFLNKIFNSIVGIVNRVLRTSISTSPTADYRTVVYPCTYLSLSFEETDLSRAIEVFLRDLRILNNKGLILGHLKMPFLMLLDDCVGSGKRSYSLNCFLFLDLSKLKENNPNRDLSNLTLNDRLGITTEANEGSANWLDGFYSMAKYKINRINVGTEDHSPVTVGNLATYFMENRDHITEIASKHRAALKSTRKTESNTFNADLNKVGVCAKFEVDSKYIDREFNEKLSGFVDSLNETFSKKQLKNDEEE